MSAFVKDRRNHCDVNCFEAAAFCAHFEAKYDDIGWEARAREWSADAKPRCDGKVVIYC